MTAVITIDQLTKKYGHTTALDRFDLTVEQGQVHGFLGPNGAGKTTTIRILLGMLQATSGSVSVFGMNPWTEVKRIHSRLAYVPGDVTLWANLSGGEAIDVLGRMHGSRHDRQRWLERFQLDPTKKCREYSKGNRQKVALVAAFTARPELLILDEPTSGLDPLMERVFSDAVGEFRDQGGTVLLSSHILSEVQSLCDRVSIIRDGRLVDTGTLRELIGTRELQIDAEVERPQDLPGGDPLLQPDGAHIRGSIPSDRLNDVLADLTRAGVRSLTANPPSLEDIFLAHYTADAVHSEQAAGR